MVIQRLSRQWRYQAFSDHCTNIVAGFVSSLALPTQIRTADKPHYSFYFALPDCCTLLPRCAVQIAAVHFLQEATEWKGLSLGKEEL